ncbi:SRPBCC family protein [Prevotella sp. P2-180]|uniref:SRPBCC family protein n=1 Tax=Prevotella sp. P2-180 TaxID=2024224 RepID=UPI000B9785F0|nr:SRPBCC family protein [Prevotella sp. P2-180]MCI6338995.1 SRPBCC family protein [Prevotella sp.]MCI7256936.1 SRPBCC family protein [Prevotella sp.]MDD5784319.1 SRPBCC family protein [Prevotella sp.]MDD6863512.1 SRPBCC family protein [Prevotella sp.]MDD7226111.1 SRPBCC family protein [Prevotella sp.]
MAKYESSVKQVNAPVERVYSVISDLERLRPVIEMAQNNEMIKEKLREAGQDPAQLEKLKDMNLTSDRVSFPAPMVGEVAVAIIEREENKCVKFETEKSPIDANLWIQVLPVTDTTSKMRVTLKADLNPMMKMILGSKLEKGIDQFADMLCMLPYNFI